MFISAEFLKKKDLEIILKQSGISSLPLRRLLMCQKESIFVLYLLTICAVFHPGHSWSRFNPAHTEEHMLLLWSSVCCFDLLLDLEEKINKQKLVSFLSHISDLGRRSKGSLFPINPVEILWLTVNLWVLY